MGDHKVGLDTASARRMRATLARHDVVGLRGRWLLAVALATLACFLPSAMSSPAVADTVPLKTTTPASVSTDPLPTVQIDGVVWAQAIVGNTVYVGGEFTSARPAGAAAGSQTVARSNLLAYDLSTGELIDSFAPVLNAPVRALASDGKRLYVGGQFTAIDGVARYRIAAFDVATGQIDPKFAVSLNSSVYGIAVSDTAVYLAGIFTTINNASRTNAAAVSLTGVVQPFAVTPAGGTIRQIVVSPDKTRVALGGNFTTLNGSGNPGYGLALVDANTGGSLPMPVNAVVRNAGTNAGIMSLAAGPEASTDPPSPTASARGTSRAHSGPTGMAISPGSRTATATPTRWRWLRAPSMSPVTRTIAET